MKGFALVAQGTEEACREEISQKLKAQSKAFSHYVTFDAKEYKDICTYAYTGQAFKRCGLYVGGFSLTQEGLPDYEAIKAHDFMPFVKDAQGVAVRILVDDCSSLERSELEAEIGSCILQGTGAKVNLSKPDVLFVVCITQKTVHIGIDFCGFDVSKRDYKLFGHRESLNGAIAFSVITNAGYTPEMKILDPFCGSGTIPIEAALYATKSPPFYYKKEAFLFHKIPFIESFSCETLDSQRSEEQETAIHAYDMLLASMKATQKNAKVAGVGKKVLCGRGDIDWMDTKFKEHEVDMIITHPPQESSRVETKKLQGIYRELFYQASYIVKKEGKVVVISQTKDLLIESAQAHNYNLAEESTIYQGSLLLFILTFTKAKQ